MPLGEHSLSEASVIITPIDVSKHHPPWPCYPPSFQTDLLAANTHPMRHRDSLSSSSGSSFSSAPESPIPHQDDSEDAPWNLVAYHIPWGSSYAGYKAGTLPGPEGACIFLRSPTPTKRQRTSQACEKCRERKAKCSGTRPSCARCTARGHECFYSPSPLLSHSEDAPNSPRTSRHSRQISSSRSRLSTKRLSIRRKASTSSSSTGEDAFASPMTLDASPLSSASTISFDATSSFGPPLDTYSPPQLFSVPSRARGQTFSAPGTAQYTHSALGLDTYRFPEDAKATPAFDQPNPLPTLEDIKEVPLTLAHPQPQPLRSRASMPQLSYPYIPPALPAGAPETSMDWLLPGTVWDGEFEFPEPDPSAITSPSLVLATKSFEGYPNAHVQVPPYPDFVSQEFPAYECRSADWVHSE